jgi:hypothetical protein
MIRTGVFILIAGLLTTAVSAADPASAKTLNSAQINTVIAAAHAAEGGTLRDGYAAMTQSGTFAQNGGAPNAFETTVDLLNGYSRSRAVVGPATLMQGYDGAEWSASNGLLTIVSLPAFVADAVTQAYLNADAFFRPEERSTITSGREESVDGKPAYVLHVEPQGGSSAELYFDAATSRLIKVVAMTANGIDTTTNDDFQTVQGIAVPMRSIDVDPSGTRTVTSVTSVRFAANLEPGALARPEYVSQGKLAAPTSIPFASDVVGTIGHIVIPVALNGKATSLIFDSGGSNFLLPATVTALGLHATGSMATGGAGAKEQTTAFAPVSSVDFGGATLSMQNFIVTPLPYALEHPRKGFAPQGLIGFEYLANFRVSVRYADQRIDVEPFDAAAPAGGVSLPFKSDGRHAYVEGTVDGISGYYLLDTGNSGGIVLNAPFVQEHHLFPNGGLTYKTPGGVGGGFAETVVAAESFAFAGQTFHDVPVVIPRVASGSFATRGVAGNLGAAFLSHFTCVFDYKAQTVTFIPNRNLGMPFLSDRTGLSLNQNGPDAFDILDVVPNSPAAEVGIAPGDRITAFDSKTVSAGYGLGDLHSYVTGNAPFSVTFTHGSSNRTMTIVPRLLLPPPQ